MFADARSAYRGACRHRNRSPGRSHRRGIGVGVYSGYADAVARAVQIVRRHEPQAEATPKYLARYEEYCHLLDAMRDPWRRLEKLSA